MSGARTIAAGLVTALLVAVIASAAYAKPAEVTEVTTQPPDPSSGSPGGILVNANLSRQAHDIFVDRKRGVFVVTDSQRLTATGEGCEQVDVRSVWCSPPGGKKADISVNGGFKDDRAVVGRGATGREYFEGSGGDDSFRASIHGRFLSSLGGGGNDRIVGTPNGDELGDLVGADTLLGRGGDDLITIEDGRDVIDAGPGDDLVGADNGELDVDLDCGEGDDRAVLDRQPHDRAHSCERIHRL